MRIYNSATHKKEEFQPIESGKVRMYVCGPTVYDNIHIGNARTFISFDVIRRWLIASGYEVTFAQNLTDVDDKIIKRANEEGVTSDQIAEKCSGVLCGFKNTSCADQLAHAVLAAKEAEQAEKAFLTFIKIFVF